MAKTAVPIKIDQSRQVRIISRFHPRRVICVDGSEQIAWGCEILEKRGLG
jgi:hypothetical protein